MVAAGKGSTAARRDRLTVPCGCLLLFVAAVAVTAQEPAATTLRVELAGEAAAVYGGHEPLQPRQLLLAEQVTARWPSLELDASLCAAAGAYLFAGSQVEPELLPPAFLEFLFLWAGRPEPPVLVATVSTSEGGLADLLDHMEETLRCSAAGVNRVGIARVAAPQPPFRWNWAYVLSRQTIEMEPFPARVEPGEQRVLRFAGRGSGADTARVLVMRPDGRIDEPAVRADDEVWWCTIDCGEVPGVLWLQVLLVGDSGPEVAGLLSVHVGQARPRSWSGKPLPDESEVQSAAAAEELLLQLVNSERTGHGLPALAADAALARIARAHSVDMIAGDFFAHNSPTRGGLSERMEAAGYRAHIARENLSRSVSIHDAHTSLMTSPSHRANLLATDISVIGVGVRPQLLKSGEWQWMITEVFAEPMVQLPLEELEHEVMKQVAATREMAGLQPLERSRALDHWALLIAERAAVTGQIDRALVSAAAADSAQPDGAVPAVRVELIGLGFGGDLEVGETVLGADQVSMGLGIHRPGGDALAEDIIAIVVASAVKAKAAEEAGRPHSR